MIRLVYATERRGRFDGNLLIVTRPPVPPDFRPVAVRCERYDPAERVGVSKADGFAWSKRLLHRRPPPRPSSGATTAPGTHAAAKSKILHEPAASKLQRFTYVIHVCEEATTMRINLAPDEVSLLRESLISYVTELLRELAGIEDPGLQRLLARREESLSDLLCRLEAAPAGSK
jgi:hypothetical protein